MAKDFNALVIGFNVEASREAAQLAQSDKVFYKSYRIIYQMLEEMEDLLTAINVQEEEREIGRGQILQSFLGTTGAILGTKVTFGRLAVDDRISINRGDKELGRSEIISIKKSKNDCKI